MCSALWFANISRLRCEWPCFVLGYRQRAFKTRHLHLSHGVVTRLLSFVLLSLTLAVHGFAVAPLVASSAAIAIPLGQAGTAKDQIPATGT
jgi:hypothetical protein